jgi:phosphatidylinositol alpha-1,6-mannosyltransferase
MPTIVTNQPTSGRGGVQRFAIRLARELAARSEVVLIEPRSGGRGAPPPANVRVVAFKAGRRGLEFLRAQWSFLRARTRDYNIAMIWFPSGLAVAMLPRAVRGPLGVIAHGSEIAPERGGLRRSLMLYTFRRADAVFANSSFTRDLLLRAGVGGPIDLVHCGVDENQIPRSRATLPTLLSVGRLVARKGFDRVIEALPAIARAVPNVRYEIVGDGPQRHDLETLARTLGVAERVTFLGPIDDDELERAYARAACFILACRRIGTDVEGFGIVYLEAAAHGLASIGGRGSGADDAIVDGETGRLVDGDSVDEIANAAIDLLSFPARAERMGALGRRRARESFTWNVVAGRIDDAMRRSVERA